MRRWLYTQVLSATVKRLERVPSIIRAHTPTELVRAMSKLDQADANDKNLGAFAGDGPKGRRGSNKVAPADDIDDDYDDDDDGDEMYDSDHDLYQYGCDYDYEYDYVYWGDDH